MTSASGLALSNEQKRERLRILDAEGFGSVRITTLDRAYLDARSLLDRRGSCADFFGGQAAERVLEELVIGLHEGRIGNSSIGIRMSGPFATFVDAEEGISYRLFTRAELNTAGPFRKAKVFPADPFVPRVGSFEPNTREARVLILLHELAHLIQGAERKWLIPDDGRSPQRSRQNTTAVEAKCGRQIRAM
jgi:hypothetical protein